LSDYFILAAFTAGLAMSTMDVVLYTKNVWQTYYDYGMSQYVGSDDELILIWKVRFFPCSSRYSILNELS
jgi:hypothetical protein